MSPPFGKVIFRMGFGRANRAPVGKVHPPCREGYEKGQDDRFQQQVQGEGKKKSWGFGKEGKEIKAQEQNSSNLQMRFLNSKK